MKFSYNTKRSNAPLGFALMATELQGRLVRSTATGMIIHCTKWSAQVIPFPVATSKSDNTRIVIFSHGTIFKRQLSFVCVRADLQSRGYGKPIVSFLVNEIMRRGEKTVTLCVVYEI